MSDDRTGRYAAALFQVAQAEGELSRVEDELYQVARALESSRELSDALGDPRVPSDRKQAIVDDLLGRRASSLTVALVGFLIGLGRAGDLPEIADELVKQAAASRERAVAEVRTAVPLDEDTLERLATVLGRATGKQLEVRTVVDPGLLGGVVARVGDTVIDGSVRRRLENLRDTLQSR